MEKDLKSSRYRVKVLPLTPPWGDFLEQLPAEEQWTMIVFGNSHSGKSSFGLKFGQELARFGNVFYANNEENLKGGTIQIKARQNHVDIRKFDFLNEKPGFDFQSNMDAIDEQLKKQDHKYCIIDSVSSFAMSKNEVIAVLNLASKYKDTSFIYILHLTKDEKNFTGSGLIKYMADVAIEMSGGVANCRPKNRYKDSNRNFEIDIFKL